MEELFFWGGGGGKDFMVLKVSVKALVEMRNIPDAEKTAKFARFFLQVTKTKLLALCNIFSFKKQLPF